MLGVNKVNLPGFPKSRWDGILGLLPTSISGSDLFVTQLFKQGKISEDSFSVYYAGTPNESEITFGGFDTKRVDDANKFTYLKLYDDYHWSAKFRRMKYGDTREIFKAAKNAILDSGTSLVVLPTEMFNDFRRVVSEGRQCGESTNFYYCSCASKLDFEPLYFLLGDYEYRVEPQNYVVEGKKGRNKI